MGMKRMKAMKAAAVEEEAPKAMKRRMKAMKAAKKAMKGKAKKAKAMKAKCAYRRTVSCHSPYTSLNRCSVGDKSVKLFKITSRVGPVSGSWFALLIASMM